jgi:hypothetical protein
MLPTIFLTITLAAPPQLPVSTLPPLPQSTLPGCPCGCSVTGICTCDDCPDGVKVQLVTAPVVIQEQLPPLESRRADDRVAELEKRVAALEARLGMWAPAASPPATMPVPAGYQRTQAATTSYVATSFASGDAGACAGGNCGTASGRAGIFNGRFRRR